MGLPRLRITLRRMMVWVAIAGWIAFNVRLIQELLGLNIERLPGGVTGRVAVFAASATLIGPIVGIVTAIRSWSSPIGQRRRPAWRGFMAGSVAGFAAWSSATILICIGDGSDGQTFMGATILGAIGATVQCIPGALIGTIWEWVQTRRSARSELSPRPGN